MRHDRRVVERASYSDTAMALCAGHRKRFVVPAGWVVEELQPEDDAPVKTASVNASVLTNREPADGRPWFLAGTDDRPDTPVRPILDGIHDHADEDDSALSAGSLLRRAFHGPDREDDLLRRDHDLDAESLDPTVDEIEQRRTVRSLDEYGTAQLPFPPLDTEPQAAVS